MNFLLTLIGVPAGLAITGGNAQTVMTATLACWLAIGTLFLRRWPLTVLILSMLSVIAFRTASLVTSGWVWPATAALAALALSGRLRAAIITATCGLLYGFTWDTFVDTDRGVDWALGHVGGEVLWVAAVLAAATAYRNTLRWRSEVARRLEQDEHERELESRRRRAEERVEIARDLHDVVSHTLAVVGVHLNVALDAFDADPTEAKESLRLAQEVRGRAMTDLKSLVGVLRDPLSDLGGLDRLVEQVRSAGLEVSLNEFGDRTDVPAPVATAVFRVVQESLTNIVRHSGASRVAVTLRYAPASVVVDVQDNGQGAEAPADGHGISGMRERVAALGGALTAGPTKGGFTVRATIPFGGLL
ncbi:signal transduction histidine kinase [Actinoplanes tereljensis]|uniref:histidine kinase n=1 Tax=Paractinoplanes tereljensis TaxID=571912 RepID=A0A919TPJ4_9ACTN|nr:sensor histidine kinase [Actinoplanes tereljensis]GIF18048.1 two-component sensor histidine kinase [Actinoplanes tereljensis]